MAVGKGSMARASRAVAKETPVKKAATTKTKAPSKTPAKSKPAASNTIGAVSASVMDKQVYPNNSQILERDAKPQETFGIGDAMPIYFF